MSTPTHPCALCHQVLGSEFYTKSQWKKKAERCCKECCELKPPTPPQPSTTLNDATAVKNLTPFDNNCLISDIRGISIAEEYRRKKQLVIALSSFYHFNEPERIGKRLRILSSKIPQASNFEKRQKCLMCLENEVESQLQFYSTAETQDSAISLVGKLDAIHTITDFEKQYMEGTAVHGIECDVPVLTAPIQHAINKRFKGLVTAATTWGDEAAKAEFYSGQEFSLTEEQEEQIMKQAPPYQDCQYDSFEAHTACLSVTRQGPSPQLFPGPPEWILFPQQFSSRMHYMSIIHSGAVSQVHEDYVERLRSTGEIYRKFLHWRRFYSFNYPTRCFPSDVDSCDTAHCVSDDIVKMIIYLNLPAEAKELVIPALDPNVMGDEETLLPLRSHIILHQDAGAHLKGRKQTNGTMASTPYVISDDGSSCSSSEDTTKFISLCQFHSLYRVTLPRVIAGPCSHCSRPCVQECLCGTQYCCEACWTQDDAQHHVQCRKILTETCPHALRMLTAWSWEVPAVDLSK